MVSGLRIGIDLDNTIITYDGVFCAAAIHDGLVGANFVGRKQAVRDAVRSLPDGERAWQRLQGRVYGKRIGDAGLVPGVAAFLRRCRSEGCVVTIVSHKTEFGHHDPDRVNLRSAALDWMAAQGLFDVHGVARENVYFENTRNEKLERIAVLSLTHFIDDLEEVLGDPAFPPNIERILFTEDHVAPTAAYAVCGNWQEIEHRVFGGATH